LIESQVSWFVRVYGGEGLFRHRIVEESTIKFIRIYPPLPLYGCARYILCIRICGASIGVFISNLEITVDSRGTIFDITITRPMS